MFEGNLFLKSKQSEFTKKMKQTINRNIIAGDVVDNNFIPKQKNGNNI